MSGRVPSGGRLHRIGLAALAAAALAAAMTIAAPPRDAQAVFCFQPAVRAAGPSIWTPDTSGGGIFYSALYSRSLGAYRDAGSDFDGIEPKVGPESYDADSNSGCESSAGGREWLVPPDSGFGNTALVAEEQFYFDNRRPFGRVYLELRNPTGAPITIDLEFETEAGPGEDTHVDRSSDGGAAVNAADAWATSCDDSKGNGCAKTKGEAVRAPELAHNWETRAGNHVSASEASFENDFLTVVFEDVTVNPGQTKSFVGIVSMALNIRAARAAADRAAEHPADFGVFRSLTQTERQRVVNW